MCKLTGCFTIQACNKSFILNPNLFRYLVVCKTWAGLIGLGSMLGWAQFWAGLDFGLGSIDYRVI